MKTKAKTRRPPPRSIALTEWDICSPLMDALMAAALGGSNLAQRTRFKRGVWITALVAKTMGEINLKLIPNDQTPR